MIMRTKNTLLWVLGLGLVVLLSGNLAAMDSGVWLAQDDVSQAVTPSPVAALQSEGLGTDSTPLATDLLALAAAEEQLLINLYTEVSSSVVNIGVLTRTGGGTGSGFVLDGEGHIVTNNHVVEGAEQIVVSFADGTTAKAELVGADVDSDLAVIQVSVAPSLLRPVELGDSSTLRVGQRAIAVGNPFGLEQTMTAGIISALGRVVQQETGFSLPQLIQTDAAINPGNSGGPLLDSQGRVIGVNTFIFSRSGSSSGVGFAVPVNTVKRVAPALITTGRYADPWLGISGVSVTPVLAEAWALPVERGVLLGSVVDGGPAAKAGLRANDQQVERDGELVPTGGDIIVAIDDVVVQEMDDLVIYLAQTVVGQSVTLEVVRSGETLSIEVVLEERPSE
jgi:S1-C subfamily serine protease